MSNRWRSAGPPGQRGRVLTLGHGRHVVVLVSPLARGENYVPTARALARHFQVHLFEMPGSGAGTRLQSPWTMVDYADWSAEMIAQCGMEGSAVVGHSYAGMVAVALAARHPTLVSALVVADTPGVGEPVTLARGVLGAIADVARDILIVSTAWPLVAWNALVHRRNVLALIQESISADITELARNASAPTLVAWAGKSLVLRPSAAKRLAECLPRSQLYIARQSVHTWVVSQSETFASAVVTFLASVAHFPSDFPSVT